MTQLGDGELHLLDQLRAVLRFALERARPRFGSQQCSARLAYHRVRGSKIGRKLRQRDRPYDSQGLTEVLGSWIGSCGSYVLPPLVASSRSIR